MSAAAPSSLRGFAERAMGRLSPGALRGAVLPLLILGLWAASVHFRWANTHILVAPSKVISFFLQDLQEGTLVSSLRASLRRDLLGFAVGSAAGVAVGALLGMSRLSERLFGPTFNATRQVALFSWVPLISVWFGTGEQAKVVFIGLAAFYPVVLNTQLGVRSVAREHLEVAQAFEFTLVQRVRRVILPSALPAVFSGLHLALIYAWLGTIGAEYLLAPDVGIGNLMIDGREQLAMDKVLVGVLVVGLVGAVLNSLATYVERRVLHWAPKAFEERS
jgi:sulfonate transport system permease protein